MKTHQKNLHMKEHLNKKDQITLKCEYCELISDCQAHLERHIKTVHMKIKLFSCEICQKSFGSNTNLNIHKRRHKEKSP